MHIILGVFTIMESIGFDGQANVKFGNLFWGEGKLLSLRRILYRFRNGNNTTECVAHLSAMWVHLLIITF